MDERIVVTGMGTLNPVGGSVKESWDNVISGVSGVAPITLFDASELSVKIAGEVKNFTPGDYLSHREVRRLDRVQQLNSIAAREAINQAGLIDAGYEPERISVIVSSAIGGMGSLEENFQQLLVNGPQKVSPFAITKLMINGSAAQIAIDYGYQGPSFSVVSACSTGADNLGMAWSLLKSGMIDVAVAGAGEFASTIRSNTEFPRSFCQRFVVSLKEVGFHEPVIQHAHAGFILTDFDHLSFACFFLVPQCHHDTYYPMKRSRMITEPESGLGWLSSQFVACNSDNTAGTLTDGVI